MRESSQLSAFSWGQSAGQWPGNSSTTNRVCFNASNARRNAMGSIPYPNPQAVFYQQYESVRRDEVVGILLSLFLGGFGIHHFYLRRTGLGILYACFCWTPFPWVLGFIECFFMPGRVREFNAIQAAGIAAALGITMPAYGQPIN